MRGYRWFNKERRERFLTALAEVPNVSRACREAGVSRRIVYCRKTADPKFAQAWEEALETGIDRLEEIAMERAMAGSDRLLMFLLKAHRPEKYREGGRPQAAPSNWPERIQLRFEDDPEPIGEWVSRPAAREGSSHLSGGRRTAARSAGRQEARRLTNGRTQSRPPQGEPARMESRGCNAARQGKPAKDTKGRWGQRTACHTTIRPGPKTGCTDRLGEATQSRVDASAGWWISRRSGRIPPDRVADARRWDAGRDDLYLQCAQPADQ